MRHRNARGVLTVTDHHGNQRAWRDLVPDLLEVYVSELMADPTKHHATVMWDADKRDLRAHTIRLAGQTLSGSCMPTVGGDPAKSDPEELFVAALSACHMLWFLDFARRERLRVLSYEDRPEGTMDGVRFLQVALSPRVRFVADVSRDVLERLHRQAHDACFIANSVTCKVTIDLDKSSAGVQMDASAE